MKPSNPAKNVIGEFDKFTDFMRRLVAVPHSEIKARIEAKKRVSKPSASRDRAASPKRAN